MSSMGPIYQEIPRPPIITTSQCLLRSPLHRLYSDQIHCSDSDDMSPSVLEIRLVDSS